METQNRPNDFRFWHTARRTMYPVEFFTEDEVHRVIFDDDYETNDEFYAIADHPFKHDEGTLMQFTGLTDRAGKQIWEGDILLWSIDSEWVPDQPDVLVHYYSQVVFRFGMFGHATQPDVFVNGGAFDPIIDPHSKFTRPTTTQSDKLLVVGNVYQHANLFRMGLFAPITLRVPFKFNSQKF